MPGCNISQVIVMKFKCCKTAISPFVTRMTLIKLSHYLGICHCTKISC